jgi:hypothetical protein
VSLLLLPLPRRTIGWDEKYTTFEAFSAAAVNAASASEFTFNASPSFVNPRGVSRTTAEGKE